MEQEILESAVESLLGERVSDLRNVQKANKAFQAIGSVFSTLKKRGLFHKWFDEPKKGVFAIDLRNFPRLKPLFPGVLVFKANSASSIVRSGFGRVNGTKVPAIVFTHYKHETKPFHLFFPDNFDVWWKFGLRDVWRHEYTHWLNSQIDPGFFGRGGSAAKADRGDFVGYYNSDKEIQAYFVEAAGRFIDVVSDLLDDVRKQRDIPTGKLVARAQFSIGKNFLEFSRKFFESPTPQDWVKALTPSNRRRVQKRVASVYGDLTRKLLKILPSDWQRWNSNRIEKSIKNASRT